MSKTNLSIRFVLAATLGATLNFGFGLAACAQINVTGNDGNLFMEESAPPVFKKPTPKPVTQQQINDLGVPVTPDGRIVPLKSDDGPVMGRGSNLEVTTESIYTPGAYYPGIPGWQPYSGFSPYWAPPLVPGTIMPYGYSPYGNPGGANLNINIGRGAGLNFSTGGGNYYNPYSYGSYQNLTQWGSPFLAPSPYMGTSPYFGGYGNGYGKGYGYSNGFGRGLPGINLPGVSGQPGVPFLNRPRF